MMSKELSFEDWGTLEYGKAYEKQLVYFNKKIANKTKAVENKNDVFFVEHPHVYTLGKSGDFANLIIPESFLKKIDASFYRTDRGGDITYHGFGQIVIYPIIDLSNYGLFIKKYIYSLEEVVIRTLKEYHIEASRLEKAAGIWLLDRPQSEKICAVGVRVSKDITMHGMALNVNTDLNYFNYINPCGFTDKGVSSVQKELGKEISMAEIKEVLKSKFIEVFSQL